MYIEDLGEYRYNDRFVLPGVRGVGWLTLGRTFSLGETAPRIIQKLSWLAAMKPVNQTRGFHRCAFCAQGEIPVAAEGVERFLGSAEIWVPGKDELFASPDLIVHYVLDHRYSPPESFLDAVENVDLGAWNPPRDYGLELYRQSLERR